MLKAVLSVANEEQSMFYSPRIYSEQYNVVTSLLKSALVKAFPMNPMVIDQLEPFIDIQVMPVQDGYVTLPEDYCNILGSPYVISNPKSDCECGTVIEEPLTAQTFKTQTLKGGCHLRPVVIYPESEFIERTDSEYKKPSWEAPIGFFSGKRQIKICPYDATRVFIMFVKNEKKYNYGYITQPDDTYLFDINTTVESEWTSAAFDPIFKAMVSLFAIYAKDPEMTNWAAFLSKEGLF